MAVDGTALVTISVGGLFIYAGIKGKSVLLATQTFIQGAGPSTAPQSNPIATLPDIVTPGSPDTGEPVISGKSPQTVLLETANSFGWGSGTEWQSLQALEMGEAGFNSQAKNQSSGAYGMAQSLGHHFPGGPAPNGVNEYGGYGLTAAQSRAASMGDPVPQCLWMCRYIKAKYGTPVNAYTSWSGRNPHWY